MNLDLEIQTGFSASATLHLDFQPSFISSGVWFLVKTHLIPLEERGYSKATLKAKFISRPTNTEATEVQLL